MARHPVDRQEMSTVLHVSDDLFALLRSRFSERELVELTAAICWENYRSRFNRTIDVGSEGFSKGNFCPLPEPESSTLLFS